MSHEQLRQSITEIRDALHRGETHTALKLVDELVDRWPRELTDDEQRQQARDHLQRDYHKAVQDTAKDLRDRWFSGEFDGDRDSFEETLRQDIDGHQRVIYTELAQDTLVWSHNDAAYFESFGSVTFTDSVDWSKLAYAALERDVIEELDHLGVDLNETPPGPPEIEKPESV